MTDSTIIVPVVVTGSPSGWTTAVVHVPTGRTAVELHAIDVDGSDMGAISAEPAESSVRPMPLEISGTSSEGLSRRSISCGDERGARGLRR